jgi:hypothetical protein
VVLHFPWGSVDKLLPPLGLVGLGYSAGAGGAPAELKIVGVLAVLERQAWTIKLGP